MRASEKAAEEALCWAGITVDVSTKTGTKRLLEGVCGKCRRGGFTIVIGPSGAGKTTLLGALTGTVEKTSGRVARVESSQSSETQREAVLAYVAQEDALLKYLTVNETAVYAAELRLDSAAWPTREARAERARRSLDNTSLLNSTSTPVADCSGGERKRLAIAVELLTPAAYVLADEPSSGLDSRSALTICGLLAKLDAGCLATLHQPSARIFGLARDLVVLSKSGRVLYAGVPEGSADRVAAVFGLRVPDRTSAAEFLLDAATDLQVSVPVPPCVKPSSLNGGGTTTRGRPMLRLTGTKLASPPPADFKTRFRVLARRASTQARRNPAATYAAVGRSVVMAVVVGLLYAGGVTPDQAGLQDRTGALFFIAINQGYSAVASVRVFVDERDVFDADRKRGLYGAFSYLSAKSVAELPIQTGCALLFASLSYLFVGLRRELAPFFAHALVVIALTLVAESLCLAVSAASPDAKTAVVICPILLSLSLLLAGFLVKLDDRPLEFLQPLSFFAHAFAALLKIEVRGQTFDCSARDRTSLADRLVEQGLSKRHLKRILDTLPCPTPDGDVHLRRLLGDAPADAPILNRDLPGLFFLFFLFRGIALYSLDRRSLDDPSSGGAVSKPLSNSSKRQSFNNVRDPHDDTSTLSTSPSRGGATTATTADPLQPTLFALAAPFAPPVIAKPATRAIPDWARS